MKIYVCDSINTAVKLYRPIKFYVIRANDVCSLLAFIFLLLYAQSHQLTTALCSRLALPREMTLFFLELRAKVNLSPGNKPAGNGDMSRCPLGVRVHIFGSAGKKKKEEDRGKENKQC